MVKFDAQHTDASNARITTKTANRGSVKLVSQMSAQEVARIDNRDTMDRVRAGGKNPGATIERQTVPSPGSKGRGRSKPAKNKTPGGQGRGGFKNHPRGGGV
ncbi:MAG: hypothetical protein GTO41_11835 [Burkholderiales bacterium]|nr:hypothetical protein [Burkholderiales bacterium]